MWWKKNFGSTADMFVALSDFINCDVHYIPLLFWSSYKQHILFGYSELGLVL